jgi:hypothetical protein
VQLNTLSKRYSPNQTGMIGSPDTMADTVRDPVDAVKTKVGDALDRGQAAVSHASDTASEMAGMATQLVKTFASELEALQKPILSVRWPARLWSALSSAFLRAAVSPSPVTHARARSN